MDQITQSSCLRIGIIGAGFSGTALLAMLHKLSKHRISVSIFEKTGSFAAGQAYSTALPFHLLNARARDMSAFEDEPDHFANWLRNDAASQVYIGGSEAAGDQFVPRLIYHNYLKSVLDNVCEHSSVNVKQYGSEVVAITHTKAGLLLATNDGQEVVVDKVVLATGVAPIGNIPFPVSRLTKELIQPWDYAAIQNIPADEHVLIIGTGLSMVDAVQSLHYQQHRGQITAVSRHGLMPLPHAGSHVAMEYRHHELPLTIRQLSKRLRSESKTFAKQGGDWRTVMNTLRPALPALWRKLDVQERKRFLRHVLPYWNVHRHRVPVKVNSLLTEMRSSGRLTVLAGRVDGIDQQRVKIRLRTSGKLVDVSAQSIVNCMGFTFAGSVQQQPLIRSLLEQGKASLDEFGLGFAAFDTGVIKDKHGEPTENIFAIGPPLQGEGWETVAVPEIRQQCAKLASHLLSEKN